MRALAAFIMKGRLQAIVAIAALTLLSWMLSIASLFASAAVALPTLRRGAMEGGILMGGALMVVALAGWLLLGSPLEAVGHTLILWLPVWLAAGVLREFGQLGQSLVLAAGLALLAIGVLFAVLDDPAKLWLEALQRLFRPVLDRASSPAEAERLAGSLVVFARYLTGMVASGLLLIVALSLLLGRWWQAILYNSGGFRSEFVALRLPPYLAYFCLALLACTWFASREISDFAGNLAIPLFTLFLLAGFAVLHGAFSGRPNAGFWLTGIYVSLVFLAPLSLIILLIGFSDTWIDWRRRFAKA